MIAYLKGIIITRTEKYVIIVVNHVGYKVWMSLGTPLHIPQEPELVVLYTHLYIRENIMELYGFLEVHACELFEMLIMVSGVGPKVALAILSMDTPSLIAGAIAGEQVAFLTKVSGIGNKIAQKIILELKEKVHTLSFAVAKTDTLLDVDAIDALVALGWHVREAREALKKVPKDITSTTLRIKEAMRILGSH